MNFFIFLIVGLGITNIVVNASILNYPRDYLTNRFEFLNGLLSCMLCTGFWVGGLLGMVGLFPIASILSPIYAGAAISVISNFYDMIADYLISKTDVYDEENSEN